MELIRPKSLRHLVPVGLLLVTSCARPGPAPRLSLEEPDRLDCVQVATAGKPAEYRLSEWSIGIFEGASPVSLADAPKRRNPVVTALDVTDRRARFVADPFMLRRADGWHMFFEVMNCGTEQGDIGYAFSRDTITWEYRRIVLDEPFHLSYPYVFEHNGRLYMVPESRQSGAINLYAADDPAGPWTFQRTLIKGSFADPSLIFHNGRWWLFAVEGSYSLAVFSSERLTGQWTRHPMSPLYPDDNSRTRPAGRVVSVGGKLMRFAQDNRERYGHRVRAFVIDRLEPNYFEEHEVPSGFVLSPRGRAWRELGMHHLDPHQRDDGRWFAVVDGAGYRAHER